MTADEITQYLTELDEELRKMDIKGEISLFGGAVMCLAFKARPATKDVDAIFFPASEIRDAAERIAQRHGINKNWLNDGVKGYWAEHEERLLIGLPNLTIFVPETDYMLAMKAIAARPGTDDASDTRILINSLGLRSADEVLSIVEKYYPKQQIPPKTQYFIQEMFEQ